MLEKILKCTADIISRQHCFVKYLCMKWLSWWIKTKKTIFLTKIKTSGFTVGMTPWCIWFKGEVESKLIQFWFNFDSALKYQPWVSVEISMLIQCLNINVDSTFVNQRLFKFQIQIYFQHYFNIYCQRWINIEYKPLPTGVWSKGQNSNFSEHGHVEYQINGN